MEYTINPRFGLGDIAYGISQKKVMLNQPCSKCGGKGEFLKDECVFYCRNCSGSGIEPTPKSKWYVDDEPAKVILIKASISKNQTVYKYKVKADFGAPYNRSSTTLFPTLDEAKDDCEARNKNL